ncbi:lysylphosphatidylglycerol synthase domain-containing protein [Falsibacillus albus]|nr:lysylphosphatidylglycerol synthase domain-containing protein [Falsibacillus albus]
MKIIKNKYVSLSLKLLFAFGMILLLYFESRKMLRNFDFHLVERHIHELTLQQIVVLLVVGMVAVLPMCLYDFALVRFFHIRIPLLRTLRYAYAANSYSNFLGFGGVGGAALRVYFYQKNKFDKFHLVKAIASLSLFYLTGLSIICWTIVFHIFFTPVLTELKWVKFVVWGFALYTPILLVVYYVRKSQNNIIFRRKYVLSFICTSFLEWTSVLGTLWAIMFVLHVPLPFHVLMPIALVSICAGIISMIPGGVGSFDLIFLMGSELAGVKAEEVLLGLALYRLIYYVFPFVIGSMLFIVEWIKDRMRSK